MIENEWIERIAQLEEKVDHYKTLWNDEKQLVEQIQYDPEGGGIMKKVFDINQIKKVSKGRRKKSIEIRIFLDDDSVFYEGERVLDDGQEELIKKIFQARLYRAKLENGYVEDNQENRDYLKYLQTYER